jgi:hypothetical protein
MRRVLIFGLLASSLLTVKFDAILEPPLVNLPTYVRLFGAVW